MRLTGTQQPLYFSDFGGYRDGIHLHDAQPNFGLSREALNDLMIRLFRTTNRSQLSALLSNSHGLGNRSGLFTFDQGLT